MTNPSGSFIWYELLTSDPDAAATFYGEVIGWRAESANQPGMDYRFFYAGSEGIGGHMKVPEEVADAGARPGWFGYIGVEDVDATVSAATAAAGSVKMPAMDLKGVGRMALVADPQGVPFYVMRGSSDQPSTSFGNEVGHCAWNELSARDENAALAFYTGLLGWEKGDAMPMGEMGDYQFVNVDGEMIGAIMRAPAEGPPMWRFYFQVADIDAATASVSAGGGTVHHGPEVIPGGEFMIIASDPQGAMFGAVGPRK